MAHGGITQGLNHFPGGTPQSKQVLERLLAQDRDRHHCFWDKAGFHNHLPHHLLAAWDLGAPARLLEAMYENEAKELSPISTIDRKGKVTGEPDAVITESNWTQFLGKDKDYQAYLPFFKSEVERLGTSEALEKYIFSPEANDNGAAMLRRIVGGALHPLIQIGYGVEFNDPTIVASGLAQTAVHDPMTAELYSDTFPGYSNEQQVENAEKPTLLYLLRLIYDSPILKPVMPYFSEALLSQRRMDALKDGTRPAEIQKLCSQWDVTPQRFLALSQIPGKLEAELEEKAQELLWFSTLLLASTGIRPNRKPRLDFFLMHTLTSSLFFPSLLLSKSGLKKPESKARLLSATLHAVVFLLIIRGRPRIDPERLMTFTEFPRPPPPSPSFQPSATPSAVGNPNDPSGIFTNPWPSIISSALHFPESHVIKTIRALYYCASKYGYVQPGEVIGTFYSPSNSQTGENGHGEIETHKGTSKMDGTIFVRAAGIVMDSLGWVDRGQEDGHWDRSALGWDAAWDNED